MQSTRNQSSASHHGESKLFLRQLFDLETFTYTYLLADPSTKEAALIDPVMAQVDRDLTLIAELGFSLKQVYDTHVHADHVTGSGVLRKRTGARVFGAAQGAACADQVLADKELVALGGLSIQALATPGHTPDSLSFLVEGHVFTGDALLIRGTGRTDFQQGSAASLYHAITEVLFALPEETQVWPGHDYLGRTCSSIGEEKRFNPRVVGKSLKEFEVLMGALGLPKPKYIETAVPLNQQCGCEAESSVRA